MKTKTTEDYIMKNRLLDRPVKYSLGRDILHAIESQGTYEAIQKKAIDSVLQVATAIHEAAAKLSDMEIYLLTDGEWKGLTASEVRLGDLSLTIPRIPSFYCHLPITMESMAHYLGVDSAQVHAMNRALEELSRKENIGDPAITAGPIFELQTTEQLYKLMPGVDAVLHSTTIEELNNLVKAPSLKDVCEQWANGQPYTIPEKCASVTPVQQKSVTEWASILLCNLQLSYEAEKLQPQREDIEEQIRKLGNWCEDNITNPAIPVTTAPNIPVALSIPYYASCPDVKLPRAFVQILGDSTRTLDADGMIDPAAVSIINKIKEIQHREIDFGPGVETTSDDFESTLTRMGFVEVIYTFMPKLRTYIDFDLWDEELGIFYPRDKIKWLRQMADEVNEIVNKKNGGE